MRSRATKAAIRGGPKRSTRTAVSYKENSSDESVSDPEPESSEDEAPAPKRARVSRRSPKEPPRKIRVSNKSAKTTNSTLIPSDGVIPPWQTLPYEVLLQIFIYAFDELRNKDESPKKAMSWVLNGATVCKSFSEPALSALYRDPPMIDLSRPHRFFECLARSKQNASSVNYSAKVKRLEFDVWSTLAYKLHNHDIFDLGKLLAYTPQISDIHIFLKDDLPPYRHAGQNVRWSYPDSVFDNLVEAGQHLRSFLWNIRLFGGRSILPWMKDIHQLKVFQTLRHITISNYGIPSTKQHLGEDANMEDSLSEALASLPELDSVYFQSSPAIFSMVRCIPHHSLRKLKIENCNNVKSNSIQDFLEARGSHLRELILDHNRNLSLAFLPHLKEASPELEVFKMDTNYFNNFATHSSSDPLYDTLLGSHEIPSWPSKLVTLEMVHLRKWGSLQAATNFFQSLDDSMNELSNLRKLVLHVILDCSWRERASFREKWIPQFHRKFLRKSSPPDPHFASMRVFRRFKQAVIHDDVENELIQTADLGRQSSKLFHVRITPRKQTPESEGPSRRTRQSQRVAQADSSSDREGSGEDLDEHERVPQGKCEVVEILIDNQRPREFLHNEGDFIDSEASGDEDWTGENDGDAADDDYAW
ncbi:MAG: hypothetical protein M1820_003507 [Bogoriella megaspora]|nr:MAG: hypothetical protein M1820_003507 [Bogoriella megaspora]